MKALLIGFGSIGTRHVRILKSIGSFDVIALRSSQNKSMLSQYSELIDKETCDWDEAISFKPDFAIISNPTNLHLDYSIRLLEARIPMLIEKPVALSLSGTIDLLSKIEKIGLPVLVGYQLRHHPGFTTLQTLIREGKIGRTLHCLGYVGQYLPDWRPNIDYSINYSAKKDMGGGVLLDLSHELNIVTALMGHTKNVYCSFGQISDLKIESEDFANILLSHEHSASVIHLNYLERKYTWYTRVTGDAGTLIWRYDKGTIILESNKTTKVLWECSSDFNRDMLFEIQMRHFLDVVTGKALPIVSYRDAVESLRIVDAAKKSGETGAIVHIN